MPAARPLEFRRRAVELARQRDKPVAQIAADLGISDSCLRRWMENSDVADGRREGLSGSEREELVAAAQGAAGGADGGGDPQARERLLRQGERAPKRVTCPLVAELAATGHDVTWACRLLGLPRSSYYAWQARTAAPTPEDLDETYAANVVFDIHTASRGAYGAPRVHAELRLGQGLAVVNRKRVARLLRVFGRQGICASRKSRRSKPVPAVYEDLVLRKFTADGPDRIWCTDIERHEAFLNRAVMEGHRRRSVAADRS